MAGADNKETQHNLGKTLREIFSSGALNREQLTRLSEKASGAVKKGLKRAGDWYMSNLLEGRLPNILVTGATTEEWRKIKGLKTDASEAVLKYQTAGEDSDKQKEAANELLELIKKHEEQKDWNKSAMGAAKKALRYMGEEMQEVGKAEGRAKRGETPKPEEPRRRERATRNETPISTESQLGPERPNPLPWRKERPVVCLSDLERYRQVEMPTETLSDQDEEGDTISHYDPRHMDENQAIRAALELIHEGILFNHIISNMRREWIERYVSRVKDVIEGGEESPKYKAIHGLSQAAIGFQDILYNGWRGQEGGAQGAKASGAQLMIKAVSDFQDGNFHCLIDDPEIEIAMHQIKGSVGQESFVNGTYKVIDGETKGTRGTRGDIRGGIHGSVEKIGHYLRFFTLLGSLDGTQDVFKESYTAQVIFYPREYFDRQHYKAAQGSDPDHISELAALGGRKVESSDKLKRLILDTVSAEMNPSAFHNKSMTDFIIDNFEADKIGWKNIGRMLTSIRGPNDPLDRDPRSAMYSLEEYLFANETDQQAMAEQALDLFKTLSKDQKRLVISVNLYKTYYYNERANASEDFVKVSQKRWGSRWGKHMSLLNFDEAFDIYELDKDGHHVLGEDGKPKIKHHHDFVDIASLDASNWSHNLEGNFLNVNWTDMGYAYNTQDHVLNILCQTGPVSAEWMKAFDYLTSADGYRHVSETPERGGRFRGLAYERQRNTLHFARRLTTMYEQGTWSHRRHGRERLPWSEQMNEFLRHFYDMHRYVAEFESAGIYGINWVGLRENQNALSYEERVAKILAKMERVDVWTVWANEIGLTEEIRKMAGGDAAAVPGDADWDSSGQWRQAGVNNYWEYLAYNAIVSFAGFKVRDGVPYQDRDFYGNTLSRVRFDLDFEIDSPEGRTAGTYWKSLLDGIPGITDEERGLRWKNVRDHLLGSREQDRLVRYGKLDEPTFSPLREMYEKGHEEYFIDALFEKYLQATFDQDKNNWVENKWGGHLMHKKRWDTWAILRRQMKYSIGYLADEVIQQSRAGEVLEVGFYVHDQIGIKYEFDEREFIGNTRNPDYGKVFRDSDGNPIYHIVVDNKGLPTISEFDRGFDHVASMSMGSVGAWRPLEKMMSEQKNLADLESPDRKKREAAEIERNYRQMYGAGDAGEEKQLSWLPLIYNKYMMLNFFTGRIFDVAYRLEQMRNGGENWEHDQCFLDVADEEQREEFMDAFEKTAGEDHNWVTEEKLRLGITGRDGTSRTEEFRDEKGALMVRDIQGNFTGKKESEDELVNLQKRALTIVGTGGIGAILQSVPLVRAREEAISFFETAIPSGVATAIFVANVVGWGTGGGILVAIPVALIVGSQFLDQGVSKETAKENARGLADIIGGARIRPLFIFLGDRSPSFALGMVGKRVLAREAKNIAAGWGPIWDSAIPMQDLAKLIKEYKDKLAPLELK